MVGVNPNAARVNLHASRGNPGVDESTGGLVGDVAAGPLSVQYHAENGVGDGVRREWFEGVVNEILDEEKGQQRRRPDAAAQPALGARGRGRPPVALRATRPDCEPALSPR